MKTTNPYKILALALLALTIYSCNRSEKKHETEAAGQFTISGEIKNATPKSKIYLSELTPEGSNRIDSASLDDKGNFSFKHNLSYPGFYSLQTSSADKIPLLVSAGEDVK